MRDDPAEHYATLGVDPEASAEAVTAAFRAAARRFHPDVPGTGDVDAFIRARRAYDVLGDAARRGAYDESARVVQPRPAPQARETVSAAWGWPSGLSLGLCVGCAGFAVFALAIGLDHLDPTPPSPSLAIPGKPAGLDPPLQPMPPAPVEGIASGYVLPTGGPVTLWRLGPDGNRYLPVGELGAFTAVSIRGVVRQHGMVEVGASDGIAGFVYANRLAPGDAAAAERARCIYGAGAPPANNEILARQGGVGPLHIMVENRRDQPAVVKFRNEVGVAVASVFAAPRRAISIDWLPPGEYRPEFAFGELWSRACRRFIAGMWAQRFAAFHTLDGTSAPATQYAIPPADAVDEPDDEFNRD